MDKRLLQNYAVWAKGTLESQIEISLKLLGINSDKDIKKASVMGDFTVIEGDSKSYPKELCERRRMIVDAVINQGYKNTIEEYAYTWFNRLVALRFMEVHEYISHGFRVLSSRDKGQIEPEILKNLPLVKDELKLNLDFCNELKAKGKLEELFRYVLFRQCKALAGILPMLFANDMDYLELLLPQTLLKGNTVITELVALGEEPFLEDVEVVGWLYQFYISVKKDEVFASKKTITKDTLPAVTQLFTPDWIVRYMAENSIGRVWLESYPSSSLKGEMKYYVEDAQQPEDVEKRVEAIRYKNVNPDEIRIIEPCCGSGHILVYAFDLLFKMYEEKGYQKRDIPTLILRNNIVGLDIDKRAAQLACFALVMKARSVNARFFSSQYYTMPRVYEIKDSRLVNNMGYKQKLQELGFVSQSVISNIEYLVETFYDAKTIGSLLKVDQIDYDSLQKQIDDISNKAVSNIFNNEFLTDGLSRLSYLTKLARILSQKYDVMITNPPYIGISTMEDNVKNYAISNYPNSKSDLFAMFMETGFVKQNGFLAMINMHSWMFLASYDKLRRSLIGSKSIVSMIHLGARAFESISGEVVQTTSFVIRNSSVLQNWLFIRLVEFDSQSAKENAFLRNDDCKYRYNVSRESFSQIPSCSISYWISDNFFSLFKKPALSAYADARIGMVSGDNERFLRQWYEINFNSSTLSPSAIKKKWFPLQKGGGRRIWYGNLEYLINWENDGNEIKNNNYDGNRVRSHNYNGEKIFLEGITWNSIGTADIICRKSEKGFIFDAGGPLCTINNGDINYFLGLLSSVVAKKIYQFLNPTINYTPGTLLLLPVIIGEKSKIDYLVESCVALSKKVWDAFETSWDFDKHPLVRKQQLLWDATSIGASMHSYYGANPPNYSSPLELCFLLWQGECNKRYIELKSNEEELNRTFIQLYGLQDELTAEVEDNDVTVRKADLGRDIKSLISYLVGVVFGRYSLNAEGLAYAGGEWDENKYVTYKPDIDGIVPIYSVFGMSNGLTAKITELVKVIYGKDTYRENMEFIADALGRNQNEGAEEALNRYLNNDFYADHLKTYQKRPIYWLFTSGKKGAFKCLIYMHRYNEDTLAQINAKYFLPESTRIKNELEEIDSIIQTAEGRERLRLEKERAKLADAYDEIIEYGQVLDHMANDYVNIDLDDGVKVNYEKFQNIEIVSDNGGKIKKNLLVSLK